MKHTVFKLTPSQESKLKKLYETGADQTFTIKPIQFKEDGPGVFLDDAQYAMLEKHIKGGNVSGKRVKITADHMKEMIGSGFFDSLLAGIKSAAPVFKEILPHLKSAAEGVGQVVKAYQQGHSGQPTQPGHTTQPAPANPPASSSYTPSQAEKVDRTIQHYPPSHTASAYPPASFSKNPGRYVSGSAIFDVKKQKFIHFVPHQPSGPNYQPGGFVSGGVLGFSPGTGADAKIEGIGGGLFLPGQGSSYGHGLFLPGQTSSYGVRQNFR